MSKVDAIFCCVGGGGLLAGVASYIKRIAPPGVKVIGVETYDGDALLRSLQAGQRVVLDEVGLFSDGTAVRLVGEETFRLCHKLVDGIVRVDTDEICAAIRDVFEDTRSIPEPAGALAVAGMKRYIMENDLQDSGKRFVTTVSGANMNFSRLRFVSERSELGQKREVLLMVEIPEKPGSFLNLIRKIYPRGISEFSYRYSDKSNAQVFLSFMLDSNAENGAVNVPIPPAASAQMLPTHVQGQVITQSNTPTRAPSPIKTGLQNGTSALDPATAIRGAELTQLMDSINDDGMKAVDISNNEMAKTHARYMVGGKGNVHNERLFRFTFPERPGSLLQFLKGMNQGWNVSLFNYRNNGGDTANILVAIQVDPKENDEFKQCLDDLQYTYIEETHNEAYLRFIK